MLLKVAEDAYVITQRQGDGHTYIIAAGRVFSHKSEADRVFNTMTKQFDAQVALGAGGTWRPELRAVKWS